jgi:hypothetical protein
MAVRTERTLPSQKDETFWLSALMRESYGSAAVIGVMKSASYLVTLGNRQAAREKSFLERITSLLGNQHGISVAQAKPPEVLSTS